MPNTLLRFYILGNIHIGLCAAVYVLGAYSLTGSEPGVRLPLFIFFSTLLTYCTHRLIGFFRRDEKSALPERFTFAKHHMRSFQLITGLAFLGCLILLVQLNTRTIVCFLPVAIVTAAYISPVLHGRQRLRDISYVKIFLIASVWGYIFILPALIHPTSTLPYWIVVLLFVEKFLFIFGLTLPFDIRDIQVDQSFQLKTIPSEYGTRHTRRLIVFSFSSCALITCILCIVGLYSPLGTIFLLLLYAGAGYACIHGIKGREELYYLGILDGLILVMGIIYILAF